ncbi:hypothetical protein QE363_000053 [Sphingomonas sp. SORGH_AS870]|nr:hypothetical protein [Sphingomonas sp. SORGH_AS_0870]
MAVTAIDANLTMVQISYRLRMRVSTVFWLAQNYPAMSLMGAYMAPHRPIFWLFGTIRTIG